VQTVSAGKLADPLEEMAESVRDTFRKSADVAACRRLVEQLNVALNRSNVERRPEALAPAERSLLEKDFAVRPDEMAEVGRVEFTTLDAYYLDESLLYRDVARALDVAHLPPVERARAALTWVVNTFRGVERTVPALPPWFAAMRGAGTPLERTYALLTLLRQLDLDACLVGDAGAATSPDGVWAVGVLADDQVYLFDARLGLPLPGPAGQGVATLAQVRTAADPFKPLALDPKLPYDVTAERAKQAQAFVTFPLSSLAPRMRFLQGMAPEYMSVRLAADAPAVRERFSKALPGVEVRCWNPPVIDALPRLLFAFLPQAEGGGDPSPPAGQRFRRYYFDGVPWGLLPPFVAELQGEPGARMQAAFADRVTSLSKPGSPRDLTLRGQFSEATEQLVAVQTLAQRRPGNLRELERSSRDWADQARSIYAELSRRERAAAKGDPAAVAALAEVRGQVEMLWKMSREPVMYIESLAMEPLAVDATYLLAVCKHEQAERLGHRPETANDRAAWQSAQRWWNTFLANYPTSPAVPVARRQLARTQEKVGQTGEARAAYEALLGSSLSPLEKLACKYRASRLK
jgi:hypothetical protein